MQLLLIPGDVVRADHLLNQYDKLRGLLDKKDRLTMRGSEGEQKVTMFQVYLLERLFASGAIVVAYIHHRLRTEYEQQPGQRFDDQAFVAAAISLSVLCERVELPDPSPSA